jgi:predicted nucleic-acid-binding protein
MTSVDTNIIVRLLTGDEPSQAAKAQAILKKAPVFIPDTVMLEAEWVLRYTYGFDFHAIHQAFTKLCGLPNVRLANSYRMQTALQWYSEGVDFADALHLSQSQECSDFFSFDRKFVREASGKGSCKVHEP